MSRPDLVIAGAGVPVALCADGLTQRYEQLGGGTILRMADGTGITQRRWRRLRTTIAGAGVLPPALAGIDWDAPLTLACIESRAVYSGGAPVALPAARRTDAAVFAVAHIGDGRALRPAAVAVADNVATITPVPGAVGYQIHYYPMLTVLSTGPRERGDVIRGAADWDIEFEEV